MTAVGVHDKDLVVDALPTRESDLASVWRPTRRHLARRLTEVPQAPAVRTHHVDVALPVEGDQAVLARRMSPTGCIRGTEHQERSQQQPEHRLHAICPPKKWSPAARKKSTFEFSGCNFGA